jgi:hypothetical protein
LAPEFDVDSDSPPPSPVVVPAERVEQRFTSFGEFALVVLSIRSSSLVTHIAWEEKTPTVTVLPSSSSQASMAYRFVDPAPFMPNGAQRVLISGRPLMKRVIPRPIQERNNDVAIALLQPLPQHHIDFADIREVPIAF